VAGLGDVGGHLEAELAGGDDDQRLDRVLARVDVLDDRDPEGERLAGARAGLADEVDAGQCQRQAQRLDGEGVLDADARERGECGRCGAEVGETAFRGAVARTAVASR
jgi:hypothetical protein